MITFTTRVGFGLSLFVLSLAISLHDPRLSPGHLEPLGAGRQKRPVEVAMHYPGPADFFASYVNKKKPLVIRSAAKEFPAFRKWDDSYFKTTPELAKLKVLAVKREKEKKITKHITTSVKKFFDRYHKENLYLVIDTIPNALKKDVFVPSVLRCKETKDIIEECGIWFGGYKSKLRSEDTDQIICALSGGLELLMLSYQEYKHKIKVSKMDKSYTKVDVERVDFKKYPGLEDVEWMHSSVEKGDCIYVPRKWIHQVNCYSNPGEATKVVYFRFNDIPRNMRPTECHTDPKKATLDQFKIIRDENELEHQREHEKEHQREHELEHKREIEQGKRQRYAASSNGTQSEESEHKPPEESANNDMSNAGNEHVHQHDGAPVVVEDGEEEEEEEEEHSHNDDEIEEEQSDLHSMQHFSKYLQYKPSKSVNFAQFQDLLRQDGNLTKQQHTDIVFPSSFDDMARKIFDTLDENRDKILTEDDFTRHVSKPEGQLKQTMKNLSFQIYRFEELAEELVESKEQGITLDQYKRNEMRQMEADERRAKLSVHDSNEL